MKKDGKTSSPLSTSTSPLEALTAAAQGTTSKMVQTWKRKLMQPKYRGILKLRTGNIAQQNVFKDKRHSYRQCPCGLSTFNQEHVISDCSLTESWRAVISTTAPTDTVVNRL